MDTVAQKHRLRVAIAERLQKMTQNDRIAESRSICRRLREELPGDHLTICAYNPMPTEVHILPFLKELLSEGHTVALPRTEGRSFNFRIVTSLDNLKPGPFKIGEPSMDDSLLEPSSIDLMLVPGIAFDPMGGRLGRGNGGYDDFIKAMRAVNDRAQVWGICFDAQMTHTVPMEQRDERVNAIVTPRGVLRMEN